MLVKILNSMAEILNLVGSHVSAILQQSCDAGDRQSKPMTRYQTHFLRRLNAWNLPSNTPKDGRLFRVGLDQAIPQ
jgi:hypothetical protein